jgi:glycerate kinase
MTSGQVVIAPDKFKGSLTAAQTAEHIAAGVRRAAPDVDVRTMPVADGGEGTVSAAVAQASNRSRPASTARPASRSPRPSP